MSADGMSRAEVVRMLTQDVLETIAKGRRCAVQKSAWRNDWSLSTK